MTHFGHVCYGYNGAINDWIGSMVKTRTEMEDEADNCGGNEAPKRRRESLATVTGVLKTGKLWRKKAVRMAAKRAEDSSKSRLNRTAFVIPPLQV